MFFNNIDQHKHACDRMPLDDELREIAKTKSIAEMTKMWGVSKGPIYSRLKRLGIRARPRKGNALSEEQVATIVQMYYANHPLYEISNRIHITPDRLRMEIKNLLRTQVLSQRAVIPRTRTVYPLCSICDARLDYDCGSPSVDGVCGLCLTDTDLPHDVLVWRSRLLGAAVIRCAMRDSKSNNGHSHEAAQWLVDEEESSVIFGLVGVSQGGCLRLLERIEII